MKVYLEVYGCTANKSDLCLIKGELTKNCHEIVSEVENADAIVILTCTVIDTTEQRMLSRLRFFKNLNKKIIVSGCMASVQKDLVKSVLPDSILLPPKFVYHINDVLNSNFDKFINKEKTEFAKKYDEFAAPILIAEGCMLSCSYCITSIARGELKSYPMDGIIKDVKSAIEQGCKEIQLTAQDTASYSLDSGQHLGELLENVCEIQGDFFVRVGMMNPLNAMKNIEHIIQAYKNPKIYKFLHLPVQSGDNKILEKMNRRYSVDDFLNVVENFRNDYSDITISTDIIVGFPNETDDQFLHSVELLKKIEPDITNITRFSARPNTVAKKMDGRIPTEIVKQRSVMLTDLCKKISKKKNQNLIGKKFRILVTKTIDDESYTGRTETYKPVIIEEDVKIGNIVNMKITNASFTHLYGKLI
jgi:MiaB-like tRNA modifying enzyme